MILNVFVILLFLYNFSLCYELNSTYSQYYLVNIFILSCLGLHLYLSYSDPGFIVSKHQHDSTAKSYSENYCKKCNLNRDVDSSVGHCPLCSHCCYKRDHHCFWVDNCIGYLNHRAFIVYLILLITFFTYSFTTIYVHLSSLSCKMSTFWPTVIDDKESFSCLFDVFYANGDRALLTLLFIQLIPLIPYLFMITAQQYLFISVGFTQHQLFKISQNNVRFSMATFLMNNLKFHSMMKNWLNFLFKMRRKSDLLNVVNSSNNSQFSVYNDHFV